ncbi:MAG: TonB-dependent receptor plug domain-containing protein [Leptospiraceae bacterium]|nr:TonB-dependent receptor plug domain-containing protein [Leptospiraceae bacterium]MDW8307174.1 TonB-dependent receptor plug domain-containing protein [Leptospiraceae bacterium]
MWKTSKKGGFFLSLIFLAPIFADVPIVVRDKKEQSGREILSQKINLVEESYGASNIAEALARQSSIYVNRYGPPGTHSVMFLRGQSPENSGVYFEGIPLNDPYGGSFNLENLPLFLFESVDLYPNSTATHLAGSFPAGALDFRLKKAKERRVWVNSQLHSLGGGALGSGVMLDRQIHYAEIAGSENRYLYQEDASLFARHREDRFALRKNEDFLQGGYTGFYKKPWREHTFSFLGDVFVKERGLPGPIGVPTEQVRLQNQRGIFALRHEVPVGESFLWQSQVFANYQNQRLKDPLYELATGFSHSERQNLSLAASSSLEYFQIELQNKVELHLRESRMWQDQKDFARRREAELANSFHILPWEKYVRLLFFAKGHFLQDEPGQERDGLRHYARRSGVQETLLLHLGFLPLDFWGIDNPFLEVYAAFWQSGRFPTLAENYGDNALLLPAPHLKRERSLTNSLGLFLKNGKSPLRIELRMNYFLTASRDLILFVQNSQRTMVAVNAGLAQLEGVETEARFGYFHYAQLALRYQYLDARDFGKIAYYYGKYLPYRPRHKAYLFLEGGGRFFRLFGGMDFIGRNFRDRYNSYHFFLRERFRLFTGLVWYPSGHETTSLSYTMRNITNETQSDVLGYPLPGRVHELRYQKIWEGI